MTEPKPPRGQLTTEQVDVLLRPIKPGRVLTSQNQSYLAQHDVRAHLTRVFGFAGWDKEVLSLELVREHKGNEDKPDKKGWYVTYRCMVRLTILDQCGRVVKITEDGATGSAQNQPDHGDAHDLAMKNAISYALKRCAIDLGDQFGLSLYNGGSTKAFVGRVVGHDGAGTEGEPEVHPEQDEGDWPTDGCGSDT